MVEELTGTARKIYYYILRKGRPATPKEIQRDLNISTISLVKYHLQKLQEAGLIKETDKGYIVVKVIDEDYTRMLNLVLPKSFFFTSFFVSSLVLGVFFFIKGYYKADIIFLLVLTGVSAYLFLSDALKKWRKLYDK